MKKVRFTEEQLVDIFREAGKTPIAEVAKRLKISKQTLYCRRHFGGLGPLVVKRILVVRVLDIDTLKQTNQRKR